jgi:trehalose/maltose hydrolase-like predicted phosphorylase
MSAASVTDWVAAITKGSGDRDWALRAEGYDPVVERDIESRLAIANGLIGTRASLDMATPASHPRTYVAGLFDTLPDITGGPALVPVPDWTRLTLCIDGRDLEVEEHVGRDLDLASGILATDYRWRLSSGAHVSMATARLVSLDERSLGIQLASVLTPADADITLEALLVPTSLALMLERIDGRVSLWRTAYSQRRIAIEMDAALYVGDVLLKPVAGGASLARRWRWKSDGAPAALVRTLRFSSDSTRTRRPGTSPALADAREHIEGHRDAWHARWRDCGITVDGDHETQRAIRFATYHLIGAANPPDERVSIAARGLTGDAYAGHVFWDTEAFLLPFYSLTWPEAARAMLMYRHHTLPAAREKAARLGYRGALYAWESADTGQETTPEAVHLPGGDSVPILSGRIEHHISADIAFAAWQYWLATHDERFLLPSGADILLETARFWSSRVTAGSDGLYHIRGVIGPDEYHENVDDNAFTNVMAQWNLETAVDAARLIESRWPAEWARLNERLDLRPEEIEGWSDVSKRLYTGFDAERRLFEQFAGYFDLEPVDLAAYEPRTVPMDVLLGRPRTQRSQVIKQADVVMLSSMLWDRFSPDVRSANFQFYEPQCGHGSSLSPGIHAIVAARLGETALARRYLEEAWSIDLGNAAGNLAGGIHMAALGSVWQAIVFGFAGLSLQDDGLAVDPRLPQSWDALTIPLRWRGRALRIGIDNERGVVSARVSEGSPVPVDVAGDRRIVRQGGEERWHVPCQSTERGP